MNIQNIDSPEQYFRFFKTQESRKRANELASNPKAQLIEMCREKSFDYLVTLTFKEVRCWNKMFRRNHKESISFDQVEGCLGHFKNILKKALFGRGDFRVNFVPIIHMKANQPHIHILMSHPDKHSNYPQSIPMLVLIKSLWKKIRLAGEQVDVKEITEQEDSNGCVNKTDEYVLRYMMKEINDSKSDLRTVSFQTMNLVKN